MHSTANLHPANPAAELTMAEVYDPNIVSPMTAVPLLQNADGNLMTKGGTETYVIDGGIISTFIDEDAKPGEAPAFNVVTHDVQTFYEDAPFPHYNDFDTLQTFLSRASEGIFARLLSTQIPINSKVLEIGCGTGQLCNFLAATSMAEVYGADMTMASLRLGRKFANSNDIPGIKFLQMNLFRPSILEQSMDLVIANGVLHHTYDTKKAFLSVARLVKPRGHIIVGLYNKIGRIRTDSRRILFKMFGEKALVLDPHLRTNISAEKRRSWIKDQYLHPQERKHSMSELCGWFEEAGFEFVSSIPKIRGQFMPDEQLFAPQDRGTPLDRFLAEIKMIATHGGEGGLFIMIGRKRETRLN